MNALFAAYKPTGISSNDFLRSLKKKYGQKIAGYSGTLDPFAKGVLIVAFNQYTRLFRFLKKTPKRYTATLWLGCESASLDNQNILGIENLNEFDYTLLECVKNELLGELSFIPPKFSAKRVGKKRAYQLAAKGEEVELKPCIMQIYEAKIKHYNHPFLSVELSVSEGAYVRSYCELFAKKLGIKASLSSLERLSEGEFVYENEKPLNVLNFLDMRENFINDLSKLENGTKLCKADLKLSENGLYFVRSDKFFSVIEVGDEKISYLLNKISL